MRGGVSRVRFEVSLDRILASLAEVCEHFFNLGAAAAAFDDQLLVDDPEFADPGRVDIPGDEFAESAAFIKGAVGADDPSGRER